MNGDSIPPEDPADLPGIGRLLAVDWGEKRIGLALSDPAQTIAQPLATLTRRSGKRFPMQQLQAHIDEHQAVGIVMGLPLESDGSEGGPATAARATGRLIAEKAGLPVIYRDERMTTARALGAVRELGGSTRHRKEEVDQLAATVLLQQFLEEGR